MLPAWFLAARIGHAISEIQHSEREDIIQSVESDLSEWKEYANSLQYRLSQYHEEYAELMDYTDKLKRLYALKMHQIDGLPLPPVGIITSLRARLTGINFFETGSDILPPEKRVYRTRFSGTDTRFVGWELNLKHFLHSSRIEFRITTVWYPPNLKNIDDRPIFHMKSFILPEWESSQHSNGYGSDEVGKLPVGAYRMEFWIGDEFVSQGQFELY